MAGSSAGWSHHRYGQPDTSEGCRSVIGRISSTKQIGVITMANYWGKQPSSRPIVYQFLTYAGNATSVPSTAFSPATVQVRVCSEVQGWLQFDGSAVSATVT